jgi:cobyrinic acid a,c-diamide synthase
MTSIARLAVGTIQPGADRQACLWGLLDVLDRQGLRVQTFRSQAHLAWPDAATVIHGVSPRHLDSWLMSPDAARAQVARVAPTADVAVVEGVYPAGACNWCACRSSPVEVGQLFGGSLDALCDWLDLPRIVVLDVARLSDCCLPQRPQRVDAVLLDRVADARDLSRWQTILESLWGIPVIGGLEEMPAARRAISQLSVGASPSRELCAALGQRLLERLDVSRLLRLARRREWIGGWGASWPQCEPRAPISVAVAYDEAFWGYFPDMLDALEAHGARVYDFSPLHDETLPPDVDVVYLGCGQPQQYAEGLADNHCMLAALKSHICSGRRVYAEGGGLAYLCRAVQLSDGRRLPMLGAIGAVARVHPSSSPPQPVALSLARDCWLGQTGDMLRGYLNPFWQFEPIGVAACVAESSTGQMLLAGRHQVLGSRVHLHFGMQPSLLQRWLSPCPAALEWAPAAAR